MRKLDFILQLNKYLIENSMTLDELSEISGVCLDIIDNILKNKLYISFHDYREIAKVIGYDYSENKFFIFDE